VCSSDLVLVVGAAAAGVTATLLSHGGGSSATSASSGAMSAPESNKATDQAGGALGAGATKSPAGAPFGTSSGAATPLPAATDYKIVVVARAGAYAAGNQTFIIVRALKGSPGKTVVVSVPAAEAVPSGDLRVLYLAPTPPKPAPTASTTLGSPVRSAFSYQDEAAQVLPLPPGASAADVKLP
jgi:hypothetical protein